MTKNQNKSKCNQDENQHSNDNIDLNLEVEIDDEVKDIINSPRKCASALLDVTIIKPQDVEKLYTVQKKTLKGDEVKKFIAAMNLDKKEMKKVISHILSMDDRPPKFTKNDNLKSAGDYKKAESSKQSILFEKLHRLCSTDGTNSEDSSSPKNDQIRQIFTTPKTFHEVNNIFECKNKRARENNDKPDTPCPCENCAIVGIVTDSQKKPFVTEETYDPREMSFEEARKKYEQEARRKKVGFKEEDHTHCQQYFKHLSKKIKELEERITVQEERAVPKDYFRKIITKLVTQLSKFSFPGSASQQKFPPPPQSKRNKDYVRKDATNFDQRSYENFKQKYNVHPVIVTTKNNGPAPVEPNIELQVDSPKKQESQTAPQSTSSQPFWKWGEEILKPGIDIKNKIILLLEETLKNLKWPKQNPSRMVDIKNVVDEISHDLYKTVNDIPEKDTNSKAKKHKPYFYDSSVNISYLNPSEWDESQASLKYEISEIDFPKKDNKKIQDYYKSEFLKIISSTKEEDRQKLWNSIWNQALGNRQTKSDKATIQLPGRKEMKVEKVIEIEYTLGELESLLIGKKI